MLRQKSGRTFPRFAAGRTTLFVASAVSSFSNLVNAKQVRLLYHADVRHFGRVN
jgi:hypothetical protein